MRIPGFPRAWASVLFRLAAIGLIVFGNVLVTSAQPPPATPVGGDPPTSAAARTSPAQCRVGFTLVSLHDLDVVANTFQAEFWIWSVCPDDRFAPLTTMEFVNANVVDLDLESRTVVDGATWVQAKGTGTFRHHWNLTDFPFDRQALRIEVEDGARVASDFTYVPDTSNPVHESELEIDGWRIVETRLEERTHTYDTNFGNPDAPAGASDFSRLAVTISLERDDLTGFIKLTFLVYSAFLISLINFLVRPQDPGLLAARLGITSATLFTVALSLLRGSTSLNSEEGLTLVDGVHIVALVAILADAVAALATWLLVRRGRSTAELDRLNLVVIGVVVSGFVLANAWLIISAAWA